MTILDRPVSREELSKLAENFYEDFLEFDSLINIRPRQGNRSRGVENEEIQERIRTIVNKYIQ